MRLGLHIGYWGLGLEAEDQLALVREAEELGFDSVWAAEAYGSDAATVIAWLAAQTERIRIGSAIFQIPARSPAMCAMTAATLDNISNGRMILGIGASGPQVAEGWHGQRFPKQIQRTREHILIYLAAIGPNNTRLAGEVADGWMPFLFKPEEVGEFRQLLSDGAERASRTLDDSFDIAPNVNVSVDDNVDRARDAMRPLIALYVGGMGSREKNFYNQLVQRYGFEDAAREVQDLYLDGKREEAAAALPVELIDEVALCGPEERIRERLAVYRDAGVGTLIATPLAMDREGRSRTMRALADFL